MDHGLYGQLALGGGGIGAVDSVVMLGTRMFVPGEKSTGPGSGPRNILLRDLPAFYS